MGAQGVNEVSVTEIQTKERREELCRREPSAAQPQPKLGLSRAKHVLSVTEGTQRPQRSENNGEKILQDNSYLPSELGVLCALAGVNSRFRVFQIPESLREPHKLSSMAVQSGRAATKESKDPPLFSPPSRGREKRGLWRVWYWVPGFGFRFLI
jgi:hypothetical protein